MTLKSDNFTISAKPSSNDFFILLKNTKNGYSVFSNGNGKGTVSQITPATFTKADKNTITGDYSSP